MQEDNNIHTEETNIISDIAYKYVPYWPLFIIITLISLATAFIYLRYAVPVYEVNANLLIKDEKKGMDNSAILESLNIFGGKKIVENEIEVLRSRALMKEVVHDLQLYAPVYMEGRVKNASAYTVSPLKVEVKQPDSLREKQKLYFTYDTKQRRVLFNKQYYDIGQWFLSDRDSIRFTKNQNYEPADQERPLFFSLTSVKKTAATLLKNIRINASSKQSTVIDLTLEDEVPRRGEDILNDLIKVYNKASIQDKNALAANTLAFVEQRLHFVVGELDSVEGALQRYKRAKGIVDISEQGKVYLQNVGVADQRMSEINMQLAVLNQVERYVISKNETPGIVPSTLGVNDAVLSPLLEKKYDLEIQYERLKKTTGENNPALVSIRDQIEKINPSILENIRNQRNSLNASRNNLAATTRSYTSMLSTIPQKERELLEISRQQEIKNNIYTFLLQKREETALSFASAIADSRVIDYAESSAAPIKPRKQQVYLIAFLAGIALTIALLAFKELLSNKILFRKDIEGYVSWPIIGEISHEYSEEKIVTGTGKRSAIAEQFRQIRTSLVYLGINEAHKRILITSSISGEGKTFVASNLAVSLALTEKKVILLELDLRKPKLSGIFNIKRDVGVSNYLVGHAGIEEIIKPTAVHEHLFFISAGPTPPNPSELILNNKMHELINYLEQHFDYILIDTAPVVPVTDAQILSKYCDATLYIIRHGITPKMYIKRLEENNKVRGLKNTAIIFNGLKTRGFGKYGYGYGDGYGYGYGEEKIKKSKSNKS